jgi:beta-catenin-like protein 1
MDYNKAYAAEILSTTLQRTVKRTKIAHRYEGGDIVEKMLKAVAPYRKKDPEDTQEQEFVENMFDCIGSLMLDPELQST